MFFDIFPAWKPLFVKENVSSRDTQQSGIFDNYLFLLNVFERELASLVALQVLSSKEREEEEEGNFLTSFYKAKDL